MSRLRMHATCEAGLEEILAAELDALGAAETEVGRRGISFSGSRELMWRANLESRTANRILVRIARFGIRDRDDLYGQVALLPWSDWMDVDQTLAVDSIISDRKLIARQLANQVVKDAICDRFRRETGRRPSVDRGSPDIPINIHVHGQRCTVSLDSSGARLHRRGYRTGAGVAPLKETLAAGILAMAGYTGERPLVDPMCGSGTFLIEAALIARRMSPGVLRLGRRGEGFAFQRWLGHDPRAFHRVVDDLRERSLPHSPAELSGSDTDGGVLGAARKNAARAGVANDIQLDRGSVADASPLYPGGVLVTNPPWGERMGDPEELARLYATIGDTLKQRFAGYTAFVLAGDRTLAGRIGLKPARRIPIHNGPIECRLLRFELWSSAR